MKPITSLSILVLLSSPCLAEPSLGTREVLLDNPTVQVVRLTYAAGSESGVHTHEYPHRVTYVVKGGTLEMIPGDGDTPRQSVQVKGGQAIFLPATRHNVRNIGDTEIVLIETEIK